MFEKTISYRRKKFKDIKRQQSDNRQNQLKVHADTLKSIDFVPNNKEAIPGLSNNFSQNPFNIIHFGWFFNSNDEPTRIQALKIKGQNQSLTDTEKQYLQRYYAQQDKQEERDNRFIRGESYKLGKKLFLNSR